MKKFIILLALVCTSTTAFALPKQPVLDKIENSLFGFTYNNESEITRLNRIENDVYGKTSNNSTQSRIAKLSKDLSAKELGNEIEPKEDTFEEPEDSWVISEEPKGENIDYPIINELEKQVFKQEYKQENIKTRLAKLENKAFGKSYQTDDLSTRVDRLKAELKPKSYENQKIAQQENSFYTDDIGKMEQNYHLNEYGNDYNFDYDAFNNRQSMMNFDDDFRSYDYGYQKEPVFKPSKKVNISKIEKALYKTNFENEPMDHRLTRIESSVFGTSFANDNESERIARISSAINAQKSAQKYDSNGFSKNMATAMQIGTILLMVLACIL